VKKNCTVTNVPPTKLGLNGEGEGRYFLETGRGVLRKGKTYKGQLTGAGSKGGKGTTKK